MFISPEQNNVTQKMSGSRSMNPSVVGSFSTWFETFSASSNISNVSH